MPPTIPGLKSTGTGRDGGKGRADRVVQDVGAAGRVGDLGAHGHDVIKGRVVSGQSHRRGAFASGPDIGRTPPTAFRREPPPAADGTRRRRPPVADHLTRDVVFAAPDWSLEEAAAAMVRGGFRHLIVLEQGDTVGILSVRDVVRCWTADGAICAVPASAAAG